MEITEEQWIKIERLLPKKELVEKKNGRPWQDARQVLNGVLWILETGAQWKNLPREYPPYQTCHRRFQTWVKLGVFEKVLNLLAVNLKKQGKLKPEQSFIDGTFSSAKKGAIVLARPKKAKVPK